MSFPACSGCTFLDGCFSDDSLWPGYRCANLLSGWINGCGYCSSQCFGCTLGVVGIASYIGAGLQDVMSGVLIEGNKRLVDGVEVYDFTYINWFWIGAALLSVLLALLVWNARSKE